MISNVVLGVSLVILLCVISEKFSYRVKVPALIFFMFVGMLFGSDGIFQIEYSDFASAEMICSIGLIFIMFDGGFNTNWTAARPYAVKAVSLSSLGVVLTGAITTVCCHFLLKLSLQESFLLSAVLASTDAASVFSILKANNLDLKDGTSSILEVESGSNDPMAYLMTVTAIGIMSSGKTGNIVLAIIVQIAVGLLMGFLFAYASKYILSLKNALTDGLDVIFVLAIVMLCYSLTDKLGGNAYLSVYILGLYLGNSRMNSKKAILSFSNELTSLLQILIFFVIGLLSFPKSMPASIPFSLAVVAILTFISRPLMTLLLLIPQKCSLRQCLLISWAGLRGASSIVFAIVAVSSGITLSFDIFHVVFLVSLFSISIQGALLAPISRKLKMVEKEANVFKTFNDYEESIDFQFARIRVLPESNWAGKRIKDIDFPTGSQALMIKRNGSTFAARGHSVVEVGDDLILNAPPYYPSDKENVQEIHIRKNHKWANRTVEDLHIPANQLIIMVIRDNEKIIPGGDTLIREGDVLLLFRGE